MLFGNKNKIKKRAIRNIDERAVGLARLASTSDLRESRRARRGKTEKSGSAIWRKVVNALLLLIFVGSTLYLLFFSPFLLVTKTTIGGTQDLDADALRRVADATIAGKYVNVVAKNNLILINKEQVKKALTDRFKRLEDVQVTKKFPDTLVISVRERKSMVILCSAGACFIIDNSGVPYALADFASNELQENNLLVINDDGNKAIKLGEETLEQACMQYLLDIKDKLKSDLNIAIDKNFHTPQLVSGDIRATTSEGWKIYFDNALPIQKAVDTLKLVLTDKIGEEKRGNLEYVDLRTENKVYYKLKNIEAIQPPVEEVKKDEEKKKEKK
ncbi:MAG: FtsQ-type POTRA domain-containing protein [Parcubacteria group bacterium]|jgi:cell division protein FtsQ